MCRWGALILLALQGCASKHEPAPPLGTCGGQGCRPFTATSQSSASGGTSAAGTSDAGDGVSLIVNVVAFADVSSGPRAWSLSNTRSLSEPVKAQAQAVDGGISEDVGSSPLLLRNVATQSNAWVSVAPSTSSSIYLPGLVGTIDWKTTTASVPLLLKDDFGFVSGLYTQTTLSLDSSKAQVALKIEDADGNGVRNARITNPGGVTVAYANAGTWIDASLEPFTDGSGRVVIVNLPAPSAPGAFITISAYGDDTSGSQVRSSSTLPIEAGFVSYGTILLDLN